MCCKLGLVGSFSAYTVTYIQHTFSDHCPILVNAKAKYYKRFNFNVDWMLEDGFEDQVKGW